MEVKSVTNWRWVFHGDGANLCTAVFTDKENAENWIMKYSLSGILTKMPIDKSIYDLGKS